MCQWCKDQAASGVIPHPDCEQTVSCPCQHGRPFEMSATEHGYAGYLDGLPEDHPARKEYKRRTGHDIVPAKTT